MKILLFFLCVFGGFSATALAQDALVPANQGFEKNLDLTTDFNDILGTVESSYGPLEIKSKTIGLDWAADKAEYLNQVQKITNTRDYFYLVTNFLSEFDDAHISVDLPSTLTYKLPLQFSLVQGKIIVSFVRGKVYPKDKVKPEIGDELIAINGISPDDYQKTQMIFNKDGNPLTNKAIFALTLSGMSEAAGIPLSNLPADIKFTLKSVSKNTNYDLSLKYKVQGVGIIGRPVAATGVIPKEDFFRPQTHYDSSSKVNKEMTRLSGLVKGFDQLPVRSRAAIQDTLDLHSKISKLFDLSSKVMADDDDDDDDPNKPDPGDTGQRITLAHREPRFKMPWNFQEIKPLTVTIPNPAVALLPLVPFVHPFVSPSLSMLLNSNVFFAGVFRHGGKRIGYLRISSYEPEVELTMAWSVRYYIAQLEQQSDVLIIDQMDNPGGDLSFSDMIIKSLVGKFDPSKHLHFAVRPSQEFLQTFADIIAQVQQNKDDMFSDSEVTQWTKLMKVEFDKVYTAYAAGNYMSEPLNLTVLSDFFEAALDANIGGIGEFFLGGVADVMLGVNVMKPQVYTKPVYFLTNELDFSGGDATPATFQDYQRGPIVGVRTAGAGGTVEEFTHRLATDFQFRLTTSLMVRKGGRLVENYGVTPNIPFELTPQDYRDKYKDTLNRLLQTLHL